MVTAKRTLIGEVFKADPPQPYTALKKALVSRTAESAAQRLRKALDNAEIGDTKPSAILRILQQ